MLQITKIGNNTMHDKTFFVDRPHGHPVYLLLFVKTKGKFYVKDCWKETPAGIAVVFRPGQQHLYGPTDDAPEFPAYTDSWIHISSDTPILPEHFPYGSPIILHNPENFDTLFHLIHNEFYRASSHRQRILDSLTDALLHKLADESNTEEFPPIYYRLVSLREYIYSHPHIDWNIQMMSESLHISSGYLHNMYKHFFQTSCMKDVIHSRIQMACELLTSTNKSVDEIAHLSGYHNTEHFIRQFKEEMQITPTKYRKI